MASPDPHWGGGAAIVRYRRRDPNRPSFLALSMITFVIALLHYAGALYLFDPIVFLLLSIGSLVAAALSPGDVLVTDEGIFLPLSLYARLAGGISPFVPYGQIIRCRAHWQEPGMLTVRTGEGVTHRVFLGDGPEVTSVVAYVMARVEAEGGMALTVRSKRKERTG